MLKLRSGVSLLFGKQNTFPVVHRATMATSEAIKRVLSTRRFVDVLGTGMSYLDTEQHSDKTVVFLHGNPTSAYLWRGVIPHVQGQARCLAPDLVGMGHSDKLKDPTKYRFVNHYEYLSGWFEKMNLPPKIVLVIHDWGSGLGFHWANQHRDRVAGIVFMEALIGPVRNWDAFPEAGRRIFQALRSPGGEEMVLQKNFFVQRILPSSIMRTLSEEEMNEYLRPFNEPGEARRPTLTWPREIPIRTDGPEDVVAIATDYNKWLSQSSDLPKLYIHAEPGFFAPFIAKAIQNWPNLKTVKAKGIHFLQEDSPDEIGKSVSDFIKDISYTSKL